MDVEESIPILEHIMHSGYWLENGVALKLLLSLKPYDQTRTL